MFLMDIFLVKKPCMVCPRSDESSGRLLNWPLINASHIVKWDSFLIVFVYLLHSSSWKGNVYRDTETQNR